jgi:hypothetical protein
MRPAPRRMRHTPRAAPVVLYPGHRHLLARTPSQGRRGPRPCQIPPPVVGEQSLAGLPEAQTRHNRNSKPSTVPSYGPKAPMARRVKDLDPANHHSSPWYRRCGEWSKRNPEWSGRHPGAIRQRRFQIAGAQSGPRLSLVLPDHRTLPSSVFRSRRPVAVGVAAWNYGRLSFASRSRACCCRCRSSSVFALNSIHLR